MEVPGFPRLSKYLAVLPNGFSSYPECRSKGVLLTSALAEVPRHESWNRLPSVVQEAIEHQPLATEWVSTVLSNSVQFAVADTYYPSDEQVLAWNRKRTQLVASSTSYRALVQLTGVKLLLRAAVRIHAMFQQGTDLRVEWITETEAHLFVEHPPHLQGGASHLANEAVFGAMLEKAGGHEVKVAMIESSPRRAVYRASWRDL